MCGKAHLQSCHAPRPPAHQWDQSAPGLAPSGHSKAGGAEGVCKENGLGMPKWLLLLLSDLEVHFQPTSDGQTALPVSQLASFGDEQQPIPPPSSGVPSLPPRPGHSAVLLGAAAGLPGRLRKSQPGEPTRAVWWGVHGISSGLSRSLPLDTPKFSPWPTRPPAQAQTFSLTLPPPSPQWLLKHL